MESKIQALHRTFHVSKEIMKSRDFTNDMHTLTSRCETIEVKVDSLGSAITDSSIPHEVQRLHDEMKIVQLNLSNIKAVSKTQPDRQLNKTTVTSHQHNNQILGNGRVWDSQVKANPSPSDNNTNLIICMDSNQKYTEHRRFWTLNGTVWKKCTRNHRHNWPY